MRLPAAADGGGDLRSGGFRLHCRQGERLWLGVTAGKRRSPQDCPQPAATALPSPPAADAAASNLLTLPSLSPSFSSCFPLQATNIKFHDGMVPRETKEGLLGQRGVVLWFTGGHSGWVRQWWCGWGVEGWAVGDPERSTGMKSVWGALALVHRWANQPAFPKLKSFSTHCDPRFTGAGGGQAPLPPLLPLKT